MKERRLQRLTLDYLKTLPDSWFYKTNDACFIGLPDIIGCHKGRLFAVELKSTKGKPTALQLIILRDIQKAGGFICLAKTMGQFKRFIKEVGHYEGTMGG